MLRRLLGTTSLLIATPISAQALPESHGNAPSSEMSIIFRADQKARDSAGPIDWVTVTRADGQRREQTQALLDAGELSTAEDYFQAAFIFQHGETAQFHLKAHLLAMISVAKGKSDALWIASASLDRYLQSIGKAQVLGTQFVTTSGNAITQEPFDRTLASDALRTSLGVPSLAEQEKRREALEKGHATQTTSSRTRSSPRSSAPSKRVPASDAVKPVNCAAIPGATVLIDRPGTRRIVVGEMHGTNETPAAFGDLVCLASTRAPVTVALEQPESEQSAIDAFIGSDGGSAATSKFLESAIWTQELKDGRSSRAYFRLFQRLRELRVAGRVRKVVAFQPLYEVGPGGFDAAEYEIAMAATLLERTRSADFTLALVGNIHAMRTEQAWAKPPYVPMAGHLPTASTLTVDTHWNGGSYWACTSMTDCGPQTAKPARVVTERSIVTTDRPNVPYSGVFYLGTAATASAPQVR